MKSVLRLLLAIPAAVAFAAGAGAASDAAGPHLRRKASSARRIVLAVGAAAMLAGLALLSAGLYTYLDTGPSRSSGQVLALGYSADPGGVYERPVVVAGTPTPSPSPTPAPSPSPTPAPADVPPPLRDRPFRMVIDSIGVDAGVFTYGLDENRVPQVPLNAWDVAWYDFSARPGTGGNAVFAGHVTWSGQAIFYSLDQLQRGDTVRLVGEDGAELVYTVSETFLVDPNDPAALSVMGATDADVMTIVTCGGTFFYTGDPVFRGDYTNRLIVRASLSSVNAVAPAVASGR